MNNVTVGASTPKTISSVELVDVINSLREEGKAELRHDNFLVKIEKHPGIDSPKFLGQYKDATRRSLKCYHLPKREAELMVMSESLAVQAKVYDRMTELEQAPVLNPANLSRMQLIQIAMESEQERLLLEAKVKEQAPKVQALDRIATYSEGSFCIRDAAKTLQIQEKRLKQVLQEHHWVYRRPLGAGRLAYADKLQQGVMEHKVTQGEKSDGSAWIDTQARVTAKGLARLAEILIKEGQQAA